MGAVCVQGGPAFPSRWWPNRLPVTCMASHAHSTGPALLCQDWGCRGGSTGSFTMHKLFSREVLWNEWPCKMYVLTLLWNKLPIQYKRLLITSELLGCSCKYKSKWTMIVPRNCELKLSFSYLSEALRLKVGGQGGQSYLWRPPRWMSILRHTRKYVKYNVCNKPT